MAFSLAVVAMPSVARAQARLRRSSPRTRPNPPRSGSFPRNSNTLRQRFLVAGGHAVTLVLDNSGAETEHGLFVVASGFRLQAKAGEIVRKNTVFEKPGEYEFVCDLPGHRDAGMTGTLIVVDR